MTRDKIKAMIISLLLKVSGISLFVFISIFLFATYLQAATPTYIQLEFSDIDYDEAQYMKFKISAYEDFKIVLYMKDNDNNTFYVTYQTDNENTGDYDKDDNNELIIYLDKDEYVTDEAEIFDSFDHSNSMSFDEYINNEWKKHNYNSGSAELEKIRIYGDFFWLYYIAIDDGDFEDPTWQIDASDDRWDSISDFIDAGHTYSSTTSVHIGSKCPDFIEVERKEEPAASVYPSGFYSGYSGYGYPGTFYGGYPGYGYPGTFYGGYSGYGYPGTFYGGYTGYGYPGSFYGRYSGYGYPGSSYGPGYNFYRGNPYNPNDPLYGTVTPPPISIPSGIMNMMASSNWNTAQMGVELGRPYFQAAVRSGWTPWSFPY